LLNIENFSVFGKINDRLPKKPVKKGWPLWLKKMRVSTGKSKFFAFFLQGHFLSRFFA